MKRAVAMSALNVDFPGKERHDVAEH